MEAFADVAPAHNPPYIKAMRMLRERFPRLPLVAAFETGFHRTIPEANQRYAIPDDWATELGIRRWGFHGASHRYIAGRMAELLGRDDLKVISCHLGGSSSLCAIRDGQSVACSLGMSPQSGLPQNNRVGDFDVFALPVLLRETGKTPRRGPRRSWPTSRASRARRRGARPPRHRGRRRRRATPGPSWPSTSSSPRSATTSAPTSSSWAGPTRSSSPAGSARTRSRIRSGVCRDLELVRHRARPGAQRRRARPSAGSRPTARASQVWTVPTNEEIVVARQARDLLRSSEQPSRLGGRLAMFVARVTGSVVATQKVASMTGHKLLTVEPYRVDEKGRDRLVPTGRTFVVVDTLGAGLDEMVLICQGSSAGSRPRPRSCRSTPW